ncbi:MAG: tRNA pseudouridine(13) synthase TruD, partial [Woeseiaceae bacterium]|nr:tRNA pseudouridine(13) synthase TruD [Woeseiaceae bacterium]
MTPLPDWPRAWGPPIVFASIRATPSEFVVDEELDIDFANAGEHDWLRIEKTGANTDWVARQLAKHAGVPARDVGYSGLKDRHAVTTQWFSVKRSIKAPTDWAPFAADGVRILQTRVHDRKLRRGTHRGNAFRIALGGPDVAARKDALDERLALISAQGVPNYFGEQRFGHGGANVELGRAVLEGKRLPRAKRSIGISALRSYEFNEALAARVGAGTWNRLLPGDTANLDGTGSVFAVEAVTPELEARCAALDVHPAGSLPALEAPGVEAGWRPLRVRVRSLRWS